MPFNLFVRNFNNNGYFKTNAAPIFQHCISIEHYKLIEIINISSDLLGKSYCG